MNNENQRLHGEIESSKNQLNILLANSGDKANQLQDEILRLKNEHEIFVNKVQSEAEKEKSILITQHVKETADMREKYETKLQDIHTQREAQKEEVRKNMETKIEEMQKKFETERQDLQSNNLKKEE